MTSHSPLLERLRNEQATRLPWICHPVMTLTVEGKAQRSMVRQWMQERIYGGSEEGERHITEISRAYWSLWWGFFDGIYTLHSQAK